jgi:hypothetical protein
VLPPPPFTISTIMSKVVVYAPAERADALLLFLLYPHIYSVVYTVKSPYINMYLIRGPHFFLLCNWLFHQLAMAGYTSYTERRKTKRRVSIGAVVKTEEVSDSNKAKIHGARSEFSEVMKSS